MNASIPASKNVSPVHGEEPLSNFVSRECLASLISRNFSLISNPNLTFAAYFHFVSFLMDKEYISLHTVISLSVFVFLGGWVFVLTFFGLLCFSFSAFL